ncbi:universal stress protein [Nakamurella leprariae]|uniref:Universal stress protein n=1 Tax=Nakamurella leprariae TaxID=2803911 RepID=A0A938YF03_9ACTN|nr:universal stress protein [Nakamurella leprariae]MBM9469487.1 universal stress protein [Nakamurella leprariae]
MADQHPVPSPTAPHVDPDQTQPPRARVVVGVDGSDGSRHAARWAAAEADRRGAELDLIHAVSLPVMGFAGFNPFDRDVQDLLRRESEHLLDTVHEQVRQAHPHLPIRSRAVLERPAEALVHASTDAAFAVVGAHASRFTGAVLGSVSLAVASGSRVPVVVVHERDEPAATGPVVLGLDGDGTADQAIDVAFAEAQLRGAPLRVVSCRDELRVVLPEYLGAEDAARAEQEHRAAITDRLSDRHARFPDVAVEVVLQQGPAKPALLLASEAASVLVVGSRGRGGIAGLLLGSTSQALMAHAGCPVVVCRG